MIYDYVLDYNQSRDWENAIYPRPFNNAHDRYEIRWNPYQPVIQQSERTLELRSSNITLTITCRQTCKEASHFYYGRHHFWLYNGY